MQQQTLFEYIGLQLQPTIASCLKMIQRISPAKDWPRVPVVISFAALLCTALMAGFFVERTTGRPLQSSSSKLQQLEGQGNRGLEKRSVQEADGVDQNVDYQDYADYDYDFDNETFTPLPPRFTTEDPTSEPGCFHYVNVTRNYYAFEDGKRVLRNYTELVRECCKGFTGVECNERIKTPPLNCSNLVCEGNPEAFCAEVSKCGRSIPFFMMPDGELAKCDNGQPSDLSTISCTSICSENPCAGLSCPSFPEAMCMTSSCDCKPLWLLPRGIQVDCSTGKHLTPEESKRRRRQTNGDESSSDNCT